MSNALTSGGVRDEYLDHLMDSYGASVLKMCYVYLKDAAMAEDAARKIFIKAHDNLDSFMKSSTDSEKPRLMRIVIDTCKYYRWRAWYKYCKLVWKGGHPKQNHQIVPIRGEFVVDAIKALPAKSKEVILLHYYQGLPVDDIADILNISPLTVYSRIKNAQGKLHLKSEWEVSL